MAFSFSNAGQGGTFGSQAVSAAQPTAQDGPELKEIQTNVMQALLMLMTSVAYIATANRLPVDKWRS